MSFDFDPVCQFVEWKINIIKVVGVHDAPQIHFFIIYEFPWFIEKDGYLLLLYLLWRA